MSLFSVSRGTTSRPRHHPLLLLLHNHYYHHYYYYYYYYYYHYYYYVPFGLVRSSSTFPREQIVPNNLRSLVLALQFLQFQAMLLFVKALCYSLHLTSSASISVFWMLLLGLQLQLEQPQLVTSSRSFSVAVLVHCNCIPFLFFQLSPFVPRHSHINKVTLYFSFVQHNSVRPSVLKDMICLDIKMLQIFDPAFSAALAGL